MKYIMTDIRRDNCSPIRFILYIWANQNTARLVHAVIEIERRKIDKKFRRLEESSQGYPYLISRNSQEKITAVKNDIM